MPMNTKNTPTRDGPLVEQATAAPGEVRAVDIPPELCAKPVKGSRHPCDREKGHKGKHTYRGE